MRRAEGIRHKIWAAFIQQMTAITLLALLGVYLATTAIENAVLHEIVSTVTAGFAGRVKQNKDATPPDALNLHTHFGNGPPSDSFLPASLAELPLGYYHPTTQRPYALLISEIDGKRLYVAYDRDGERHYLLLIGGGLIVLLLAAVYSTAWMAYRASRRALSPVIVLADTVRNWDPKEPDVEALLPENLPVDVEVDHDVGSLAQALYGFAVRLDEFVDRERNFTRDASHELRTPLTVIKVGADTLLDEDDLPMYARRTASRIRRAARDMEALIDSFLILAREDGVGLPEEDFTINEAVREEVERAKPLVDDKPLHLSLEERAVFGLRTSPRAFGVLVGNLIRNACMYTERGAVTVTIDTGCLIVRDTGIGMSEEDLAHVFESFYRGGKGEGHGIGLSIVKRLADRFGWEVDISSKLGVGTTIRVGFPIAER